MGCWDRKGGQEWGAGIEERQDWGASSLVRSPPVSESHKASSCRLAWPVNTW